MSKSKNKQIDRIWSDAILMYVYVCVSSELNREREKEFIWERKTGIKIDKDTNQPLKGSQTDT